MAGAVVPTGADAVAPMETTTVEGAVAGLAQVTADGLTSGGARCF